MSMYAGVMSPSVVVVATREAYASFPQLSELATSLTAAHLLTSLAELSALGATSMHVSSIVLSSQANEADVAFCSRSFPTAFVCVLDGDAAAMPARRLSLFEAGANMVSHDVASLMHVLTTIVLPAGRSGGSYTCNVCGLMHLTEAELWAHMPTYHINTRNENLPTRCCVCHTHIHSSTNLQVHIHDEHHPTRTHTHTQTHALLTHTHPVLFHFALVVCKHPITHKYLLVQEFANQGFWLPGGACDGGESFQDAARREALEEAGLRVELKGVLCIEFNPNKRSTDRAISAQVSRGDGLEREEGNCWVRMRVVFLAEVAASDVDKNPKSVPCFESAGAAWCSADEILGRSSSSHVDTTSCGGGGSGGGGGGGGGAAPKPLQLRGNEPRQWVKYLEEGGQVYSLDLLKEER